MITAPRHRRRDARLAAIVLAMLLLVPDFAQASNHATILLGNSGYWSGFVDFWTGQFKKQDSIVMFVLGMGALSIFIITRGKWRK